MVSSGLETAEYSAGFDPVCFDAVQTQAEQAESPVDARAPFLEAIQRLDEATLSHERRQRVQRVVLNRHFGTLLLGLKGKKVLSKMMSRDQLSSLRGSGFKPEQNMHITALGYENGSRVIKALGGQRKRLGAVEAEASRIDWAWQPAGEPFAFRHRRSGNVKVMTLVVCPGIEDFYGLLEDELPGLRLERGPAHIALMHIRAERARRVGSRVGGIAVNRPISSLNPVAS